jgi:hypothetical protein
MQRTDSKSIELVRKKIRIIAVRSLLFLEDHSAEN